jgi:glycosyltransferase involved in cell wall biosynthesis
METIRFSLVVPVFNEEEVLPITNQRLLDVMTSLGEAFEIIYINDGSRDRSGAIIRTFCQADARIKLLEFSRNFGHQPAITAGMDHAAGQAIIIIDADLQDPPELIGTMVEKWRQGFDVVYGRRRARQGETWFKQKTATAYYRMLNRLTDVPIPVDVGDFRLIDARVRDALLDMPEHNRYVRGLISWLGFSQTDVEFVRAPRLAGQTKYPLRKMVKLGIDGITSFSYKPLKLGIGLGIILSIFSFLFLIFVFVARLFDLVIMEPGYASLMCVILFFFGITMIMLGIIGEYIGRIFEEVKGRPLYVISQRVGRFARKGRDATRGD